MAQLLGVSSRWPADECRGGRVAHVLIVRRRHFTMKQVEQAIERFSVQPEHPAGQPQSLDPGRTFSVRPATGQARRTSSGFPLDQSTSSPYPQHWASMMRIRGCATP
ncbi:hypothetical protein [Dactylosporangium sp. CA-152071]|uniref:hypothetical protein n=1 Tax=Dactylosporangium sp. CA-152071 TaxID=3239933 RepID=UPI003D93DC2C